MSVAIVSDTCHYLPRRAGRRSRASTRSACTCTGPRGPSARARSPTTTSTTGGWAPRRRCPTTSQPSIGDFLAVYEPLLEPARRSCRSIWPAACPAPCAPPSRPATSSATGRSGSMSSTPPPPAAARGWSSWPRPPRPARAPTAPRWPSTPGRPGLGLKMWFAIDTLEYLRRGGRIAGAQAWLGSALKIKPILTVESEITPVERVRTSRRAFERMVDLLRRPGRGRAPTRGWSSTSRRPSEAEELARRGTELFGVPPRVISRDRPGDRHPRGPGPARRRRAAELVPGLDRVRAPSAARPRAGVDAAERSAACACGARR